MKKIFEAIKWRIIWYFRTEKWNRELFADNEALRKENDELQEKVWDLEEENERLRDKFWNEMEYRHSVEQELDDANYELIRKTDEALDYEISLEAIAELVAGCDATSKETLYDVIKRVRKVLPAWMIVDRGGCV